MVGSGSGYHPRCHGHHRSQSPQPGTEPRVHCQAEEGRSPGRAHRAIHPGAAADELFTSGTAASRRQRPTPGESRSGYRARKFRPARGTSGRSRSERPGRSTIKNPLGFRSTRSELEARRWRRTTGKAKAELWRKRRHRQRTAEQRKGWCAGDLAAARPAIVGGLPANWGRLSSSSSSTGNPRGAISTPSAHMQSRPILGPHRRCRWCCSRGEADRGGRVGRPDRSVSAPPGSFSISRSTRLQMANIPQRSWSNRAVRDSDQVSMSRCQKLPRASRSSSKTSKTVISCVT